MSKITGTITSTVGNGVVSIGGLVGVITVAQMVAISFATTNTVNTQISNALNNGGNPYLTTNAANGLYLKLTGGTMSGSIAMAAHSITNVGIMTAGLTESYIADELGHVVFAIGSLGRVAYGPDGVHVAFVWDVNNVFTIQASEISCPNMPSGATGLPPAGLNNYDLWFASDTGIVYCYVAP